MRNSMLHLILNVTESDIQSYENLKIIPLFYQNPAKKLHYLSLTEALKSKQIEITELDSGARVSDVSIFNHSKLPVLILDGEMLIGAKQNRVANASYLIPPEQKLIIKVSCMEHGRWQSGRNQFRESGSIMLPEIRASKNRGVHKNLKRRRSFQSDQQEIWDDIKEKITLYDVSSVSDDLSDFSKHFNHDKDEYMSHFRLENGQKAILVLINQGFVGFDYISNDTVFADLYPALIESYVLQAISEIKVESEKISRIKCNGFQDAVEKLIVPMLEKSTINNFPSIGMGDDCRIEYDGFNGSALIYEREVIHMNMLAIAGKTRENKERVYNY